MNYKYINPKHKYFYKESNNLKRLRKRLYKNLINIYDASNNKKYEVLSKLLVRRITIWKPTPYFSINLSDISNDIKIDVEKLNDIELDFLMNTLIERIFRYSLRHEHYFSFQYFQHEIQTEGLLKWEFI
jgi:hypothetical protein